MKIETDGRLKLPVFINAGLKNQHLHDIVMKTTGKLKKGIRMQLKSLNDIAQYLETVQRSSYVASTALFTIKFSGVIVAILAPTVVETKDIGSRNRRQTECNQTCLDCRGAKEEKILKSYREGTHLVGRIFRSTTVGVYPKYPFKSLLLELFLSLRIAFSLI